MPHQINPNYFILFFFISVLVSFLVVKISNKIFFGLLIDKDFNKPQAFHKNATPRAGGLSIIILFILFILYYLSNQNIFLADYLTISSAFFILGFLDDLKINLNPNYRLLIMLLILLTSINLFPIEINRTGLAFLNSWLENNLFQYIFVILCFLFIINGANLIDGFNGLLAIQFLIITSIYLIINFNNQNFNLFLVLFIQIIIVFSFLLFNFPKAKIFLGDGGSYLLGSLIALNTIKTYELNISISPFFYTSILCYLFFEVFFSFIRKAVKKKSPLKPDSLHLHMLLFNYLNKIKKGNNNFVTSVLINSIYLILVIPLFFLKNNGLVCRYYFFGIIIFYLIVYFKLKKVVNFKK
jgi:UDP-GlcNAc:undecaprenyl-phosphate GlcNAc-1-phosphate transferase